MCGRGVTAINQKVWIAGRKFGFVSCICICPICLQTDGMARGRSLNPAFQTFNSKTWTVKHHVRKLFTLSCFSLTVTPDSKVRGVSSKTTILQRNINEKKQLTLLKKTYYCVSSSGVWWIEMTQLRCLKTMLGIISCDRTLCSIKTLIWEML